MESKIVSAQLVEAHNVIWAWREDMEDKIFEYGLALEEAKADFLIPRYVAILTMDDGTVWAVGISSFRELCCLTADDITPSAMLVQFVNESCAKAFVRSYIEELEDEEAAKEYVYAELMKAGVAISEPAKKYLLEKE